VFGPHPRFRRRDQPDVRRDGQDAGCPQPGKSV